MAFVTGQDWIDATRAKLLTGYSEQRNVLAAPYTAGTGTLTFTYALGNIVAGATISVGLNIFYVFAVNTSALTATVVGGQNGSTDISLANGTLVRLNPKFTDFDIWNALAADLADLSSPLNGLYGMTYTDFSFLATIVGYDLGASAAANLIEVYEVRYLTPGNYKDSPRLKQYSWKENRQAYAGDIPSGMGVEIVNSENLLPGRNMRVFWKSAFTLPAAPTAPLSTSLVIPTAYDLPPIGAAIILMAGQEIKRNFTSSEGDMRRATEVPAGAVAASSKGLKDLRQLRIDAEAARLINFYPPYKD